VAEVKELHVTVVDSVYNTAFAGGVVVEQFPLPGAKVKNNRVIQLTVNARSQETVVFPNLHQSSFRQALQRLKNSRLKPGKIIYAPSPYANLVIGFRRGEEVVEAGTRVRVGEVIDVLLGRGETTGETAVPRLFGKTLEEARELLLYAYLNPGEVVEDYTIRNSADRAIARVYDQRPREGVAARRGEFVTMFLSKNLKKEPEELLEEEEE
jgi:beta-lactam-binding protein with PASTA domain